MLSILHEVRRAIIFTFFEVDNTWTSTYFSFNANLIKLIQLARIPYFYKTEVSNSYIIANVILYFVMKKF